MQDASRVLLALKEDQSRWGCTPRAQGGGKVSELAQEAVLRGGELKEELKGSALSAEAFGRAELLSAPTEICMHLLL